MYDKLHTQRDDVENDDSWGCGVGTSKSGMKLVKPRSKGTEHNILPFTIYILALRLRFIFVNTALIRDQKQPSMLVVGKYQLRIILV